MNKDTISFPRGKADVIEYDAFNYIQRVTVCSYFQKFLGDATRNFTQGFLTRKMRKKTY